jgi:hypothetical protein
VKEKAEFVLDEDSDIAMEDLRHFVDSIVERNYEGRKIGDMPHLMKQVQVLLDIVKAEASRLQVHYDIMRRTKIPNMLEEADLKNFRADDGLGITVVDEWFVSTKNPEALIEWMKDNGEADLVKEQINPSTLKAFVKRKIEKGEDYPYDDINVTVIPTARFC